jgi:hypothetical protein
MGGRHSKNKNDDRIDGETAEIFCRKLDEQFSHMKLIFNLYELPQCQREVYMVLLSLKARNWFLPLEILINIFGYFDYQINITNENGHRFSAGMYPAVTQIHFKNFDARWRTIEKEPKLSSSLTLEEQREFLISQSAEMAQNALISRTLERERGSSRSRTLERERGSSRSRTAEMLQEFLIPRTLERPQADSSIQEFNGNRFPSLITTIVYCRHAASKLLVYDSFPDEVIG